MGYTPVVSKENLNLMQSSKGAAPNYGLGFVIVKNDSMKVVTHDGGVPGYVASFGFEQESKYGVIILRNYNAGAMNLGSAAYELLNKMTHLNGD
jgi:hypothetical protein